MPQAYVQMKTVARMQYKGQGAPYLGPGFASYLRIMKDVYGRRPFRLEQGHVVLCPAKAKEGDLLCVLAGMSGPVVLRRVPERITSGTLAEGKEHYELVGEAYASGITDGELWHLEPPLKARRFEIG
jgi:hypothetical protein